MTRMAKWRTAAVIVLLLLLAVRATQRVLGPDTSAVVLVATPQNAEPHEQRVSRAPAAADTPPAERTAVTLHVDVAPAGSELEWTARLYLQPTAGRERTRVAEETRRGAASISWQVPCDTLALHVTVPGGVGESWTEFTATPDAPQELRVSLQAHARFHGTVRAVDGTPLPGARVLFVATESAPVPRGVPPALSGGSHPAFDSAPLSVETDAAGRYAIARIDPRVPYDGAAAAPGHAVQREYGLVVTPGGDIEQDFVLDVGCRVVGRLLDSTAVPIPGARIAASMARSVSATSTVWEAEGESTTGTDGRFAFDCLTPGWKKLQTVVSAAPGETVVGHWECRVSRGEVRELGDVLLPASLLEAEIRTPEGDATEFAVRLALFPTPDPSSGVEGALLTVPVVPDDAGFVRVRGLPAGRVMATVRDAAQRDDGRYRPRSDFEFHFDGTTQRVRWKLATLRDALSESERAAQFVDGRVPATVTFEFPESSEEFVFRIETYYDGQYQSDFNNAAPAVCSLMLLGYCTGVGVALEMRFVEYVSIFMNGMPEDIAAYSVVPDN